MALRPARLTFLLAEITVFLCQYIPFSHKDKMEYGRPLLKKSLTFYFSLLFLNQNHDRRLSKGFRPAVMPLFICAPIYLSNYS